MKTKHFCSNGMRIWSVILRVVGFLGIVVGILVTIFDEGGGAAISYGFAAFLLGVLLKGLYPISQWAEKSLADAGYEEFLAEEKNQ